MGIRKSLLTKFLAYARTGLTNHPQYEAFPHWTFFVRNNELLNVGLNRVMEPPKKFGYHARHEDPKFRPKIHSELDALRNFNRGLHNLTVVNIRLNREGQTRLSIPCQPCRNLLINVLEVDRIYFTTEEGWGSL
jgi:hypothetical protein